MNAASELIARINRATQDNQDFEQVISDTTSAFATGHLSQAEVDGIMRAADAKLQTWDREIKRDEMALKLELGKRVGKAGLHRL